MLSLNSTSAFGSEGTGNQVKLWVNDTLIKLNSKHREAEKEYSAYQIGRLFGLNTVEYKRNVYKYRGVTRNGCECKNFLKAGESAISAYNLYELNPFVVTNNMPATEYFAKFVNSLQTATQLDGNKIQHYIMQILVFDYLICNADRHLSNIEFIQTPVGYKFAPIFDNGQSFLLRDSKPTQVDLKMLLYKYKARPFSSNPDKNIINKAAAQQICSQFVECAEKNGGLDTLQINEWHKYLVKYRIKQLLNK